ncbi:MAG: TIGR04283 family arsenosugar biosynthesis glycosyltransferase [Desulfamplus sp.]|nr:TIGR04283 family arsenosugar biosynthesis glycosyltransferase [Desulfamplus sp.]
MIPALGALGAAECHRKLTEKTVLVARNFVLAQDFVHNNQRQFLRNQKQFTNQRDISSFIRFYYDGGSTEKFQNWLGSGINFQKQTGRNLGQRMRNAIADSFEKGAEKVVLVGTDLPDLTVAHFQTAFDSLNTHDLILGPSMDGGYWLVGMRKNTTNNVMNDNHAKLKNRPKKNRPKKIEIVADIFDKIDWSTERALAQTLAAAAQLNLKTYQLDLLNDLDTPDDLEAHDPNMEQFPVISVIIPTLNEADRIGRVIDSALNPNCEVIVVDGGSTDETIDIARKKGVAKTINGSKGRAGQQNLGANAARGDILLFLHADTLLPPNYAESVFMALLDKTQIAGAFTFKTDSTHLMLRFIALGVNLRSRWLNLPYGDQALFFRRSVFEAAGGFPESLIAEDLLLMRNLLKQKRINKEKLAILPLSVITSARRWNSIGILRTTIINLVILFGVLFGVSPEWLAGLYRVKK